MDIGSTFRMKRQIKTKRHFDENPDNTNANIQSEEESFRINYFISVVAQAISSLRASLGILFSQGKMN